MGASAYPLKTHRKKRGYAKDLISGENNERRNDSVKEGQCELLHDICCTSPLQAYRITALAHSNSVHNLAAGLLKTGYKNITAVLLGGIVTQLYFQCAFST
jgi:hypothetical protein